ncbi:MAG: hypothetical protein DHS20C14_09940 [Phycisphaeraceae bacterium]|nr:MAG: hypothetical protein DHS20C14_09940 [Phycisphaeraceae bacterium]
MTETHTPVKVVLVGHCRPDQFMLKSAIESLVPGATVESVSDSDTLRAASGDADLLLVNRVLDGVFDDAGGIDLIERVAAGGARAMLISNLPDALAESETRGGVPGFGKSELRSERMRERLLAALGRDE